MSNNIVKVLQIIRKKVSPTTHVEVKDFDGYGYRFNIIINGEDMGEATYINGNIGFSIGEFDTKISKIAQLIKE